MPRSGVIGRPWARAGLPRGILYLHARAKVNYHWRKARWHASNPSGFTPGDRYLHARAKVNYHWRKARWHASNATGFIPGIVTLMLGRRAITTDIVRKPIRRV